MAYKKILVMTAVGAERDAVVAGIGANEHFTVALAGVGPASAAAKTAVQLTQAEYDLVISAGIGGGFKGKAALESIVVGTEIIAADLGADSPDGFVSIDELGFGSGRIAVEKQVSDKLTSAMTHKGIAVGTGSILTVSTVTGTERRALDLSRLYSEAAAEAMEGFGVATAAQDQRIPVLEIRSISNPVGPRDREAWRIKEALQSLSQAFKVISEELS